MRDAGCRRATPAFRSSTSLLNLRCNRSAVFSTVLFFRSCSQKLQTEKPILRSALRFILSRRLFRRNFGIQ